MNKHIKRYLTLILSVYALHAPVIHAATLTTTVHGEAWGTAFPGLKNYAASPNEDELNKFFPRSECFRKKNTVEKIGKIELDSIDYCYQNDKLAAVLYKDTGAEAFDFFHKIMQDKYGQGQDIGDRKYRTWLWNLDDDECRIAILQYDTMDNKLSVSESHCNMN